jgi:BirA family transcriptional regulator, biotin operon repressor / biotin---[acetyl-CoA-carboxylase] ligase
MSTPDPALSSAAVSANLDTQVIGREVIYFPSLASTMDVARDAAHRGAAEGTVVIAGEQTSGRGRLKRSWLAPSGNIALSVILYPGLAQLPEMIMLASLAVARSIENVTGVRPDIKWPNDILIKRRKVCGILIESDARPAQSGKAMYVNIGIGINVNLQPAGYKEIESTATSLSLETGLMIPRLALVRALIVEMDKLYREFIKGNSLFDAWRKRLVTIGRQVKVVAPDAVFAGIAESVARDGSLLVRCPNGELRRVVAGDVTLRS